MIDIRGITAQIYPFSGFKAHLGKVSSLTYKGGFEVRRRFFGYPELGAQHPAFEDRGLYAILNYGEFLLSINHIKTSPWDGTNTTRTIMIVYIDSRAHLVTVDPTKVSLRVFKAHLFHHLTNTTMPLDVIVAMFML
jgi:hypothetical protein